MWLEAGPPSGVRRVKGAGAAAKAGLGFRPHLALSAPSLPRRRELRLEPQRERDPPREEPQKSRHPLWEAR